MAANLRRLASASASALSHRSQPPVLVLRLALSSSAPSAADPPAAPAPEAARMAVEGEEAAEAKGAAEAAEGKGQEENENGGGEHVNKATGEIGGPRGPEPTRYGDWERGGRCSDF